MAMTERIERSNIQRRILGRLKTLENAKSTAEHRVACEALMEAIMGELHDMGWDSLWVGSHYDRSDRTGFTSFRFEGNDMARAALLQVVMDVCDTEPSFVDETTE